MLSIFKLVSCKPGASRVRELALRLGPQGLRSYKCSKFIFGNIIVVIWDKFAFFWLLKKSEV